MGDYCAVNAPCRLASLMRAYPPDPLAGKGKYYAVNVPLRDGITDESYATVFKPVRGQRVGASVVGVDGAGRSQGVADWAASCRWVLRGAVLL